MTTLAPRLDALDQPNIRTSEGAGTTTLVVGTDLLWQIFTLSAARTCVLPSANVLKGQRVRLDNAGAFDLTVQASNGSALTVANSTNQEATIQIGYVELVALQDAPTAPTHWRVISLVEEYTATLPTPTGAMTTAGSSRSFKIYRDNKSVRVSILDVGGTFASTNNISYAALIPLRFRPTTGKVASCVVVSAGNFTGGLIQLTQATGNIIFYQYNQATYSNPASIGVAGFPANFSYYID